jgi:anti-sigma regulatory factor (Ser/Thr protein kinase)
VTAGAGAFSDRQAAFSIPADIHAIPELIAHIRRFGAECALTDDQLFRIELSLDELINNVIDHGYPGRAPGWVSVRLRCLDAAIEIVLDDDADLYDPFAIETPDLDAGIEERPLGGLGVHLVRSLMSEVRYQVVNGHNSIQLRLALEEPT